MENQIRTFSFLLTEIETERERDSTNIELLAAAKNRLITQIKSLAYSEIFI